MNLGGITKLKKNKNKVLTRLSTENPKSLDITASYFLLGHHKVMKSFLLKSYIIYH